MGGGAAVLLGQHPLPPRLHASINGSCHLQSLHRSIPTWSTTARAQESLPPLLISHCICSTTDLRPCHHFKPQHSKTVDHEHDPEGHCGLPEGVVMEGAEFRQRVLNEDGSINSGKAFERERVMRASLACTFVPESPEQTGRLKQGPCWPRSAEG